MNHKWIKSERELDKAMGEKSVHVCKMCGAEKREHYPVNGSYFPPTFIRGERIVGVGKTIDCIDWEGDTICDDEIMGESR